LYWKQVIEESTKVEAATGFTAAPPR